MNTEVKSPYKRMHQRQSFKQQKLQETLRSRTPMLDGKDTLRTLDEQLMGATQQQALRPYNSTMKTRQAQPFDRSERKYSVGSQHSDVREGMYSD